MIWGLNRMAPCPTRWFLPVFGDLSGLPPILVHGPKLNDAGRCPGYVNRHAPPVPTRNWKPGRTCRRHLFEPILPEAGEAFERIGQLRKAVSVVQIMSNNIYTIK